MIDCKCSFSITLIKEDFACEQAQLVTRRVGPDIACASEQGSKNCQQLYQELKLVGLPAFGAEDDLLKTPASVFFKIQFGGLLSLQKRLSNNGSQPEKVDNIYQLVTQVLQNDEVSQRLTYQDLVNDMTAFKIKRKKITKRKIK